MTIKPIGNRAVIKLLKTQTTKSGIIISTEEKHEKQIGEILEVGGGFDTDEGNIAKSGLKKGDMVMVSKYGGDEINDENDSETVYKVVNLKDILAIIQN